MTESKPFTSQHADYLKIRKLASNIYSRLLVIECYCSVYNYNEIKHIQPILKNIIEHFYKCTYYSVFQKL